VKKPITYAIEDEGADYFAQNIRIENGYYHYDITTPHNIFENLKMGLPGKHNVENSVAATAIACEMGVSEENIREALSSFSGVKRRFDYQVRNGLIYIDDYAHHPEELKATISSVREMYPGKKITGIFQPHLFSRTRDFAEDFARSLDLLDECILLEIYPARELPIPGVNAQMLLDKMKCPSKMICSKEELLKEVISRKLEVLITMGAGDIDTFVEPIKNELLKKVA
jgi:UDP-N-acetylmuramate--alanine ligase